MAIQAFRLGAIGQDSLDNIMSAFVIVNTGNDNWMTFESPEGTDYVVTAGYTLYITKITWQCATGYSGGDNWLGYADAGVASGTTALTNPVIVARGFPTIADQRQELEGIWAIPAGKYPYFYAKFTNTGATIFGIEVAN